MRRLRYVIPAVLAVVAVLLGAGLLVYDHAQADTIAKGVKVAGIDIGGLNDVKAEVVLRHDLLASLQRNIYIDHGRHRFTLTVKSAKVKVSIDKSISAALTASRRGSAFSRGLRELTGGKVDTDIQPQVSYSHHAVLRLLDRINDTIDRDARNASVKISADGLVRHRARVGLHVRSHELHELILAALTDPAAKPRFSAATIHTQPKVRTVAAEKQYRTALVVNRSKFTLTLYKHFKVVKRYSVSIGVQGLETPAGLYHIQNKAVNPGWQVPNSPWAGSLAGTYVPPGPADPIKARWLGIIDGAGIHGVDPSEYGSIGHAGSHGCVRMTIPDVIDLYPRVPVGTPIYIA